MGYNITQINFGEYESSPLRDIVYKELRDSILKGELEPETRLMEIPLSEALGVSRTPVREAIRMLEKEDLVVTFPRRGAQVAHMSIKDLENVIELRSALEVLAITKACDNANEDTANQLEHHVKAFKKTLMHNDHRELVNEDEAFHDVIYNCAGNDKLAEMLFSLREQMYRYRFKYIKGEKAAKDVIEEHKKIIEGIKKKDKIFVTSVIREHLNNQYESVKRLIESGNN